MSAAGGVPQTGTSAPIRHPRHYRSGASTDGSPSLRYDPSQAPERSTSRYRYAICYLTADEVFHDCSAPRFVRQIQERTVRSFGPATLVA